jgi:hypothetical protein
MSRIRGALAALSGLAIVAAVAVGCSQTVTGTPQADPAQTGQSQTSETTTSRTPRTTRPETPSSTTVPTRTTGPSGPSRTGVAPAGADTTCGEYTGLDEADKQAVIEAIGEDNPLIAEAPEMWTSIADMLCEIATPSAYVKDVIMGEM